MSSVKWIIGIDEVGRGSLAGPVVVCALAIPRSLSLRGAAATKQSYLPPLRDSKKLTALQREKWAAWAKAHPDIHYMVARVYPRGIERMNISQAANLAATRACFRLLPELVEGVHKSSPSINSGTNIKVFLDGGLYLESLPVIGLRSRVSARTIIRGDEKFTAIKFASIVAKVARDKFMMKLHERYPQYGFFMHKGYGTRTHIAAIKKFGPSEIHRATFVKKFIA